MAGFGSRGGLRVVGVVRKDWPQAKPVSPVRAEQPDHKEKEPTQKEPRS